EPSGRFGSIIARSIGPSASRARASASERACVTWSSARPALAPTARSVSQSCASVSTISTWNAPAALLGLVLLGAATAWVWRGLRGTNFSPGPDPVVPGPKPGVPGPESPPGFRLGTPDLGLGTHSVSVVQEGESSGRCKVAVVPLPGVLRIPIAPP